MYIACVCVWHIAAVTLRYRRVPHLHITHSATAAKWEMYDELASGYGNFGLTCSSDVLGPCGCGLSVCARDNISRCVLFAA